jgi:hypothetical protein
MSSGRCAYGVPVLAALVLLVLAEGGNTSAPPGAGTAMTGPGRATVRGRVTLEGPAPDVAALDREFQAARFRGTDRDFCLKAPAEENEQQDWRIGDDGGVANVVVWLRPADGSHFVMSKEDLHPRTRTWAEEVVVGQPHLNFTPRLVVLFPSHFDPASKKQVPTGQTFKVTNTSRVACDLNWRGDVDNPGGHVIVPVDVAVKAEVKPARLPVALMSSIHHWMRGYAWAFDHPYAAVTGGTGRYEIRKAPAGVELRLMAWHERVGYLYGRDGLAVELKDGDNRKDLRVRANK